MTEMYWCGTNLMTGLQFFGTSTAVQLHLHYSTDSPK